MSRRNSMGMAEFQNKAEEIVHQILEEMYEEATPSMDYRKKLHQPEREDGKPRYLLHYLPQDRQVEIMNNKFEELGIPEQAEQIVKNTVKLGASPCTNKERVNKEREDAGLKTITELKEEN